MNELVKFFKAPLNQAGLVTLLGAATAVLQGSLTWQHAVPLAVGAVVAWLVPDNTLLKEDVEAVVTNVIKTTQDVTKPTPANGTTV